jgi:hypothetical protein
VIRWGVLLPWLGVVSLIVRWTVITHDTGPVPAMIVFTGVSAALCIAATHRQSVTVNHEGVTLVAFWRTTRLAWRDVVRVDQGSNRTLITARDGTHVTPLSWAARPDGAAADAPPMGDVILRHWNAARAGATPPALDPWLPTRDPHGRVVIRRPLASSLMFPTIFAGCQVGQYLAAISFPSSISSPTERLVTATVLVAAAFGLGIVNHRWARVTIDDHQVISRTFSHGVATVPRERIFGVVAGPVPKYPARPHQTQLALAAAPMSVTLFPTASDWSSPLRSRPDFYRMWAWLNTELAELPIAADPSAPLRPDPST